MGAMSHPPMGNAQQPAAPNFNEMEAAPPPPPEREEPAVNNVEQ
jgi:hypothetical protein